MARRACRLRQQLRWRVLLPEGDRNRRRSGSQNRKGGRQMIDPRRELLLERQKRLETLMAVDMPILNDVSRSIGTDIAERLQTVLSEYGLTLEAWLQEIECPQEPIAGNPRQLIAPEGIEPPTNGLGNRCSILLSYGAVV